MDARLSRRSLLAALGVAPFLRGQEKEPATFSTNVRVVNLFANVRNKKGEIVKDLTKDEFLLDEDGRPQVIRYFSQESNLPLTLGLLVDTSGSQRRLIGEEREASYRFFDQVLRPEKDVAFVIHFDYGVELLQDITSSRKLLERALEELESPSGLQRQRPQQGRYPMPGPGPFPGGGRRTNRGGGTDLFDAVLLGSDDIMRKQSGRKALIILSDGVDTGSKVGIASCIEAAQRADTLTYSILFEDPESYGGGMGRWGGGGRRGGGRESVDGKKVLDRISRETGGRFFQVTKRQPLSKVFAEINDDLRHQYSIGYTPDTDARNREFRRIHLTTKQRSLIVTAREGYYPS